MTENTKNNKFVGTIKAGWSSLRIRFFIILVLSIGIGIGIYFLVHFGAYEYIDTVYLLPENKKAREKSYIDNLQDFVDENKISSEDTEKLSKWAKQHKYVYLLIYKDEQLFYTSDDADKDEDEEEGGEGSTDSEEDKEEDKDKDKDKDPGGVTIDYPSREELFEYAKQNDLYPLELADGTMFASLTEFTEYVYYDVANIASLAVALLFVIIVITAYFHFITNRIIRLGSDVNKVAEGDMDYKIRAKGNDEISKLSVNVDNMRTSMIENFRKEREALDSNTALITSMSHDIRTPLTVLLGYIDVMRTKSDGDEEMQSYLTAAETTAMRLKKLSDDMFSYFLVFGGKEMEINIESYDGATLIEQMLSEHILLMKESGYQISIEENAFENIGSFTISTDAQKLIRIFDNIFSNIYKYADKGSPVSICFEKEEDGIKLVFKNVICKTASRAESNGIGLKTCKKLGEYIGVDFNTDLGEEFFTVTVTLKANKT